MENEALSLIAEAFEKYGTISLPDRKTLVECFGVWQNQRMFWFDDKNGSTHIVARKIKT